MIEPGPGPRIDENRFVPRLLARRFIPRIIK